MKLFCRYLPILDWGAKNEGKTFDALTTASVFAKRASKDVMGGAS